MAVKFLNDVTVDSSVLYVDTTNNRVGVNQTSPIGAVHILGPNTNPAMTTSALVVEQGDGAKILIDGNDIDAAAGMLYLNDYSTNDVVFGGQIRVGGGGSPVGNSWFANGNVGIGTTSPGTKLDVSGSAFIGASHSTAIIGATSFACGDGNTISAFSTFAAGHLTTASGDISAAFGYDTTASGAASFSTGALTTASGGNSFAAGGGSTASGGESAAFGYQTVASGEESFAIGNGTTASGASSFAGGGPTTLASADNAFAFGADVDVTGSHSAGFGRLHDINGTENLVGGLSNTVNGAANLVGGAYNFLGFSTNNLVAGGSNALNSGAGNYNTMIGFSNELSSGSYSFVGGQDAFCFGSRSISFGSGTTASTGDQQFAFGEGTTTPTSATAAYGSNQFVVGKFNTYSTGGRVHLFAVGNGLSDVSRTNAFNVDTLGRVGVNQYLPAYTFDVTGTGRFTGDMYLGRYIFHNGDTNTWMGFPTNDTISFRTNSSDRMYINSSGNVGIGITSPSYKLDVDGDVRITQDNQLILSRSGLSSASSDSCIYVDNTYTGGGNPYNIDSDVSSYFGSRHIGFRYNGTIVGHIQQQGTTGVSYNTTASDERLKKNIENWQENVLDKFEQIEPKKFNFISEAEGQDKTKGFIAQKMVADFPEAYTSDYSEEKYYSFNPSGMVVYLMKAVKELVEKNKELENRLQTLENK